MTLVKASSAALLALLVGTGAAWAQSTTPEPTGRNQTEGQLTPGQAQEVAPSEENLNMDTTPVGPPATTGSIESEAPAASDDDVPDENRSISGKVHEETEGSTRP